MKYEHAIIIGGGITGMLAAKVLSSFYREVFIIEKDKLPDSPANRLGTPQAFHPHRMLPLGKQIVERLFPGYTKELLAMGGFNTLNQTSRFITKDGELQLTDTEETAVTRRAMLEWVLTQRIIDEEHIHFLEKHEAISLQFDKETNRVIGLIVKDRHVKPGKNNRMTADLVIDTSGRMSKLQKWLTGAGLTLPQPDELNVSLGYSTRYYRIPSEAPVLQSMVVAGQPKKKIPTGLFERVDHDLVAVLLSAAGGHYPTTDADLFDSETATLTHPAIAEAITHLTPYTNPKGFRVPSCVRNRYEQMPDWPSGLLVMGDALCTLDPIHGQGMTKAALEAQTLERMLKQAQKNESLSFEKNTLQQMQHAIEPGWWLCAIADMAWEGVELKGGKPIPHLTFIQEYLNHYVQYAVQTKQPERLEAYHRMHSFLTEPREIINLEQLHDMIQADASGETTRWWRQWDKKNNALNQTFFHEAVPDFHLYNLLHSN